MTTSCVGCQTTARMNVPGTVIERVISKDTVRWCERCRLMCGVDYLHTCLGSSICQACWVLAMETQLSNAAPDLLAACKAVLEDEEESFGAYEYAISAKLRQQLVDAVAKAEGTK